MVFIPHNRVGDFEGLVDDAGKLIALRPKGVYLLPVSIVQTTTTAADATVWTMRLSATASYRAFIRRIVLNLTTNPTTPTAVNVGYNLQRFSAATPTLGTALAVIKLDTLFPVSGITDARVLDTGLTTTGVTFETTFATIQKSNQAALIGQFDMSFLDALDPFQFTLDQGQGLAIRLGPSAAVAGQGLSGYIEWEERE